MTLCDTATTDGSRLLERDIGNDNTETSPTVGIVIPTYERRDVLERAITSAIEQTSPPEHIVVVDGGSSFDIHEYLPDFENRLTVIVQDDRQGPSAARNTGFEVLDTDYVAFLDSDDYWAPTKLERQLTLATNKSADFVYCDQWIVEPDGTKHPSGKELYDEAVWDQLLNGWVGPNPSSLLLRSETFEAVDGFDTKLTSCEDHDLWLRIAQHGATFAYVPERLSYFTREADNRLSYSQELRLPGVHTFLEKWRPVITAEKGRLHYYLFRWEYLILAYSMCRSEFEAGNYRAATSLFVRYLSMNPIFYFKAGRKILETLTGD
jgi:glycosyltransferase involved in cell wall biosynthesis